MFFIPGQNNNFPGLKVIINGRIAINPIIQ